MRRMLGRGGFWARRVEEVNRSWRRVSMVLLCGTG
jgi:hypothetical protein